jgi:ATP-dependent Clp protease, protease subunit
MIRQPIQRFQQMQASDIDIYRNEIRKTNGHIVSRRCTLGACAERSSVLLLWCASVLLVEVPNLCAASGMQVELLSKHTEHDQEKIAKDILRPKYFDPHAAIEYNLIDRVLEANELGVRDAVREASKFS